MEWRRESGGPAGSRHHDVALQRAHPGLSHDGSASTGYYLGHGSWAPIMGVGYYKAITQWSRGEYAGANNLQDDFAVMADAAIKVTEPGDYVLTVDGVGAGDPINTGYSDYASVGRYTVQLTSP